MKTLLRAGAAVLAFMAGAAQAADLPVKPPLVPAYVAPGWSWTGFYVGANVGYSIGRDPTTQTLVVPPLGTTVVGSFKQAPAGFLGGGQVGYNWQVAPTWVLGVEADWQWSGQKDSSCVFSCPSAALTLDQSLKWFATARARVGYAQERWLWYVTGGGVWGRINNNFALTQTGGAGLAGATSASYTNSGWVAGVGVETALGGNWSAKLEYLYMSLGSTSDGLVAVSATTAPTPATSSSDIRDHVVRAGVNYRFGAPAVAAVPANAPVYKAPVATPVWSWAGFYVGGNVGYSIGRDPTTESAVGSTNALGIFNEVPAGFLGGAQVGYNWHVAPHWVLGLEADWQWSGQKDSSCVFVCATPVGGLLAATLDQSLKWFGTARARFGYAEDRWLWYATGGAAWGRIDNNFAFTAVSAPGFGIGVASGAISASHNNGGWVAGAGVETALGGNWSAKVEYLYMSLGNAADTLTLVAVPAGPPAVATTSSDFRDHILRVGINYRFGGPVIARY